METYEYQLGVFQGPLDLLLHLIEKHKIDIYDIPIVEITSQYLQQLETWQQFDIHYSSEFLVMAATLLHIKSRLLLPKKTTDEVEEDPRDTLVKQLVEFKAIKACTNWLVSQLESQEEVFARPVDCSEWGQERLYQIPLQTLFAVFRRSCEAKTNNKQEERLQVEKDPLRLEDVQRELALRLERERRIDLYILLCEGRDKEHRVLLLLAVLELVKQQRMMLQWMTDDVVLLLYRENGGAMDVADHRGS